MTELTQFGVAVLIVSGGVLLALLARKFSERFPVPAPALFLIAAALASDVFPDLRDSVSIKTVERIAVVALVVILFDGGMHVGWRRFKVAAVPISVLGIAGTFVTAGLMTVLAHYLFDFGWTTAGILGAALAPTDPAVMFSLLGNKEVRGRTGTILEGESGVNDPVGIALMIGMLEFATADDGSFATVIQEFSLEMAVGLAVGILGAAVLVPFVRHVTLPSEGLYPLRTLAAAGVIYGLATVAHGSGFLAVFIVGLALGDLHVPHKESIERFHTSLASLAEIVVFAALGITIDITELGRHVWVDGLLLALLLAVVARPLALAPFLTVTRLRMRERVFLAWGGLKGAVPILLAAFAVLEGVSGANRIYGIVFVVVAFSVIVQGGSLPFVARRLGIRMRSVDR